MDAMAFVLALVPILWLVVVLFALKWPAWKAAIGSFVLSCVLALGCGSFLPVKLPPQASRVFFMALWPIVLVIIATVLRIRRMPWGRVAAPGHAPSSWACEGPCDAFA